MAAAFMVVADKPDTIIDQYYSSKGSVISVQKDGVITMVDKEQDTSAYFIPDANGLFYHQILMRGGKQDLMLNRGDGDEAYMRSNQIRNFLGHNPG